MCFFMALCSVIVVARFHLVESFTKSMLPPRHRQSSLPALLYSTGGETGPIIFEINSPSDLKDFVCVDDRPAVIKVFASWCKTCKVFDVRYRKIASIWGEKLDETTAGVEEAEFSNLVRFAQMEYGAHEEMCKLLNATRLPYILIYKRQGGKMAGFTCPPNKVHLLVDALHEHALPPASSHEDIVPTSVEESDIEMGTILAEGTKLIQEYMSDIQQEASFVAEDFVPEMPGESGYYQPSVSKDKFEYTANCRAMNSFQTFCAEHTQQDREHMNNCWESDSWCA